MMKTQKKQHKFGKSTAVKNTVAANPLLGKSGSHGSSTKAKRQQEKVQLKKTWFEQAAARAASYSSHVFANKGMSLCQ